MKNWEFSKPLVFCAAFVLVFGILVLSGCDITEEEPTTKQEVSERIEVVGSSGTLGGVFTIVVDKETGVHYLWGQNHNRGGLTEMYNADGTLYTGVKEE